MQLLLVLVSFADQLPQGPEPEDVKAGWTAFVIFLALAGAVVFLMFSMNKQLRRVREAREAGVYGDEEDQAAPTEDSRSD